jgi:hypothetical protein
MSAAANAAGYLYFHGELPVPQARRDLSAPRAVQLKSVDQPRAPKVEYRKRRVYSVPSTA